VHRRSFVLDCIPVLERNQSNRAFEKCLRGGFFLRKKPLCRIALGYSYSGFAIVAWVPILFCRETTFLRGQLHGALFFSSLPPVFPIRWDKMGAFLRLEFDKLAKLGPLIARTRFVVPSRDTPGGLGGGGGYLSSGWSRTWIPEPGFRLAGCGKYSATTTCHLRCGQTLAARSQEFCGFQYPQMRGTWGTDVSGVLTTLGTEGTRLQRLCSILLAPGSPAALPIQIGPVLASGNRMP
jgi:hypothetical protein